MSDARAKRIAELNDRFRKDPTMHGTTYMTDGVIANGPEFASKALAKVMAFDHFTEDNDPHGEHDFGSFKLDGETLFWKVDYYSADDPHLGSEEPSHPGRTARVLTIMLAEEY
ncbi:MAG: DUF3768 domain-containing protein [Hyphomicrobiaceae bacterium]